jgi:hypothetical protein
MRAKHNSSQQSSKHQFYTLMFFRLLVLTVSLKFGVGLIFCNESVSKPQTSLVQIQTDNKYGLWPGLIGKQELISEKSIFGLNEVHDLRCGLIE